MFDRSVNKAVVVGNLGRDPEMKYAQNGNAICNFSVASSESWKNKQTGEYESKSEWHNIVVFGKFADMVGRHLKKGTKVYVEGKLQTSNWDGDDGKKRYKTEIVAKEIQIMYSGNDSSGGQQQSAPQNQAPQQPPAQQAAPQMAPAYQPQQAPVPQHAPQTQSASQPAPAQAPAMQFDDSEIPF